VPLSPKEKYSDEESDVRIVSSVGDAPHGRSPPPLGDEAPCDEGKTSSASTSSSSSSSENTGQSALPSATGGEKDCFVGEAEEEEAEEEDPECSNYRVTLEDPQADATRLQILAETKLIGGKQICFLGLMSGGHDRKFLEEVGSSFAILHKEEYFSGFSTKDLITACGDLALKNFVASRYLERMLEWEDKEAKNSSTATTASLQKRVTELEKLLVVEHKRSRQL
jgi:hypothetical protein